MINPSPKKDLEKIQVELSEAFSDALSMAFDSMSCDLRCVDWLSYNSDFFIDNKKEKVA